MVIYENQLTLTPFIDMIKRGMTIFTTDWYQNAERQWNPLLIILCSVHWR